MAVLLSYAVGKWGKVCEITVAASFAYRITILIQRRMTCKWPPYMYCKDNTGHTLSNESSLTGLCSPRLRRLMFVTVSSWLATWCRWVAPRTDSTDEHVMDWWEGSRGTNKFQTANRRLRSGVRPRFMCSELELATLVPSKREPGEWFN